jgi:TonB family protein
MRYKKILIVDFDANSLDTLSEFLKEEGFQVIKAKDGQSGLEKFESERPDLLILEPMIPKIHGFDLCKNIANDSGKETPVIFTTEFYGEEQCKKEASRPSTLTAFFRKPYRKEELLSSVLDLLKQREKKNFSPSKTKQPEKQMKTADSIQNDLFEQNLTQKPGLSREKKKSVIPDEINKMLQDTLSEFGLNAGKVKTVIPEKAERKETKKKTQVEEEPVVSEPKKMEMIETEENKNEEKIEIEEAFKAEEKTENREEMEIKEAQAEEEVKTEALLDEDELFRRSKAVLFTEFHEEPKKLSFSLKLFLENLLSSLKKVPMKIPAPRIVLPLAFATLIAGTVAFYLLQPNPPTEKATLNVPGSQQDSSQLQSAELPSSILATETKSQEDSAPEAAKENTVDKQMPEKTTRADTKIQPPTQTEEKPSAEPETVPAQKKESSPPPVEAEPLISESMDIVEIKENPQVQQRSAAVQAKETNLPLAVPLQQEKLEEDQEKPADTVEKTIKTGDLVALDTVDTPPILIRRVQPRYPPVALTQAIECQVLVNALISETGEVIKTMIIRGEKESYGFNQASEEAVKQWRFRPAIKDSIKVKVWKPILITFKKK